MWNVGRHNYSDHSTCLFTFLVISFDAQMFLILMKFNLLVFCLVTLAFDIVSKNPLQNPKSWRITPIFFSKSCIVVKHSYLGKWSIFKIVVYSVRKRPNFILWICLKIVLTEYDGLNVYVGEREDSGMISCGVWALGRMWLTDREDQELGLNLLRWRSEMSRRHLDMSLGFCGKGLAAELGVLNLQTVSKNLDTG